MCYNVPAALCGVMLLGLRGLSASEPCGGPFYLTLIRRIPFTVQGSGSFRSVPNRNKSSTSSRLISALEPAHVTGTIPVFASCLI